MVPGGADALTTAAEGDPDAPLVPVSEQEVFSVNAAADDPQAVAVYPSEGSPTLDYPVLRLGAPSGAQARAVDAVVTALTSAEARDRVRQAGFRGIDGEAPPGAGDATGVRQQAPEPLALDPAEVQALFGRLASLAAPSRLLAVFDVSTSMEAPVGDGTRATLARDAAKSALTLFPDNSAIGLWVFARQLSRGQRLGRAPAHASAGRRRGRATPARRPRRAAGLDPRPAGPGRHRAVRHDPGRRPRRAGRTTTRRP